MASVTYWAVLPFVRDEDGMLCPDEGSRCKGPSTRRSEGRSSRLLPDR